MTRSTRRHFFATLCASLVTAPLIKAGILAAPKYGLFNPRANIAATLRVRRPQRFLVLINQRFRIADEAFSEMRQIAINDKAFYGS